MPKWVSMKDLDQYFVDQLLNLISFGLDHVSTTRNSPRS